MTIYDRPNVETSQLLVHLGPAENSLRTPQPSFELRNNSLKMVHIGAFHVRPIASTILSIKIVGAGGRWVKLIRRGKADHAGGCGCLMACFRRAFP